MKRQLFILLMLSVLVVADCHASDFRLFGGRWWGIRASYSLKWYTYRSGGHLNHCDFWGNEGVMQGIEFGLSIQPRFGKLQRWGIATGVFGTVYSSVNSAETKRIEDVGLFFPFHVLYYHEFSRRFAFHAETGPGLNIGLLQDVIDPKDSTKKGYHLAFNQGSPRRVNWYWELGAGVSYRIFRFGIIYSLGLTQSHKFLSVNGLGSYFYSARPHRLTFNFGVMF